MQMHKLMIAVLAAASLLSACSDETKDKSKEAAASAAKDVKEAAASTAEAGKEAADKAKEVAGEAMDKAKETAGAAMDSAKEHVHEAAASVANACAKSPQLRAFFLRDCPRVNIGNP